jgi:hypothetical protein
MIMRCKALSFARLISGIAVFAAATTYSKAEGNPHLSRGTTTVKLEAFSEIKLERSFSASPPEVAEIKRHISNLANMRQPDFGLSATMSGTVFSPLPESAKGEAGLILTSHGLNTSDDLRALVAFGPKALPYLLAELEDKTPTRLKLTQSNPISMTMYFSNELGGNPTNVIEQTAIAALPSHDLSGKTMDGYTVKVGDVCFVIVGQIVGREYLAVRYQPTAIVVINSPVNDPLLATEVRSIWSKTNAAQGLLDSFLFDYSTRGFSDGKRLSGWDVASDLQANAAMRMLYYFPEETATLIAARLAQLDVREAEGGFTNYMVREGPNGVIAEDFIKAVSWCDAPPIRRELFNVFKKTTDTALLLAALPGIEPKDSVMALARLRTLIEALPPNEEGSFDKGHDLLVAFGKKFGEQAKPTFVRYLRNASLQRWRTMNQVLRVTRQQWAAELLLPALADKREFGWDYSLIPGQNEPRRPIRVCDEAAETIKMSRPDLKFQMAGEHGDLDRQIEKMRQRIASENP